MAGRPRKKAPRRANGEGTVSFDTERGGWIARFTLPDGKRIKRRAITEDEAREKLAELRRSVGFIDLSREVPTVAELVAAHLDALSNTKNRAQSTLATKSDRMRVHIAEDNRIGGTRIDRVTRSQVQQWLIAKAKDGKTLRDGTRKPYSLAYLRDLRADMAQMFKWAMREQYVMVNPAEAIELPNAEPTPKGERLSAADAERFVNAVLKSERRYALYFLVVLMTGARPGEVAALRWHDLDADDGVIHIRKSLDRVKGTAVALRQPKTLASVRDVAAPAFLFPLLRERRKQQMQERLEAGQHWSGDWDDLVFLTSLGNPPNRRNFLRDLQRILDCAGIDAVSNYDLRRTCLSLMADNGADIFDIMAQAGHVDERMAVKHYVIREDRIARGGARVMEGLFGSPAADESAVT